MDHFSLSLQLRVSSIMAEVRNPDRKLASITLRPSHLTKLIFPKAVMQKHHLLPQFRLLEGGSRRAAARLKCGDRCFHVTLSLGRSRDRLVLLETGWRDVIWQLGLDVGDKVTISLEDRSSVTYSMEFSSRANVLARGEGPQAEEDNIYPEGDNDHINLDQGGDEGEATDADLSAAGSRLMLSSSDRRGDHYKTFDLNKSPVESDEE